MKRIKLCSYCYDLPQDCLIIIFLFLDGPSIYNIQLTCKKFNCVINNTVFWKLYLKENKSWKDLCKKHMSKNIWSNLDKKSNVGMMTQIKKSPILLFFKDICTKVADMGYWGIYFWYELYPHFGEFNSLKWNDLKDNNFRHFDFNINNQNNINFNSREIYDQLLHYYKKNNWDDIIKYLKKQNVYIYVTKRVYLERFRIKMHISWEKKIYVYSSKDKKNSCIIL